ncbi:MAG: cytochrome c biogenesis protein CcdA [Chloroflexota bacterium]
MQEAIQNEKPKKDLLRSRNILIAVALLMTALITIGIINDATAEANPFVTQQPFVLLALLAFVGGALSFLAPCTLPILPAYFAFAAQSGRSKIASNTLIFMLGVATVFSLFGASASALGSIFRQSQSFILLLGGSAVVIFGVMSLLGKGFTGVAQEDHGVGSGDNATGAAGTFLFGMTFAAGWSSCIGPILGIMLTMAATTSSVLRGAILLFIYALGLGLPLVLVSTFIGRASRTSLIWRILRGKGWNLSVPDLLTASIWGIGIWIITMGGTNYASRHVDAVTIDPLTTAQSIGLLLIVLVSSAIFVAVRGQLQTQQTLHLHTTSLFSGILFVGMGWLMVNGWLELIAAWAVTLANEATWYQELEFVIFNLFQ